MVIPIVSLKGGVGKSTITLNLADLVNLKYNNKVLIIDTDPQNSISYLLCKSVKQGLSEVLLNNVNIEDVIEKVFDKNSLYIIPNGYVSVDNFNEYENSFSDDRIKNILNQLDKKFDFIFIDTPPQISNITYNVLKYSNLFFIVITPEPASIASLKIFFKFLEDYNLSDNFFIIVNKLEPNELSEDFYKYLLSFSYKKVLGSIPRDKVVLEAQANCTTVIRYDRNSAFVAFLEEVVESIEKNL